MARTLATLQDRIQLITGTARVTDAQPGQIEGGTAAYVLAGLDEFLLFPFEFGHGLVRVLLQRVAAWLGFAWALPPGDGRPVVLAHGMGDDGRGLAFAGWVLRALGYSIHDPGCGKNDGDPHLKYACFEEKVKAVAKAEGRVTVVGHSLGGIFAHRIGTRHPELLEHVLRVASPTGGFDTARPSMHGVLRWVMGPENEPFFEKFVADTFREPVDPSVPLTSLAAAEDGMVQTHRQFDASPHGRLRIVPGTHLGTIHGWPFLSELAGVQGILRQPRRAAVAAVDGATSEP